jgi:hypothetical protein
LLLHHLTELANGRTDRLMVLMPPGSAKSTYASLLLPAWWLMRFPGHSIIAASHTQGLATHFGRAVRRLVRDNSETLGYGLARDDQAAHRFRTDAGGEYFAAGLDGEITGRRADPVLIDDPIKSHAEADSATQRDAAWNWYRSELSTRLKPRGRIILIMTRWHTDDLGGRLLAADDDWRVLKLPALAEADDPLGRKPGEALWPVGKGARRWSASAPRWGRGCGVRCISRRRCPRAGHCFVLGGSMLVRRHLQVCAWCGPGTWPRLPPGKGATPTRPWG